MSRTILITGGSGLIGKPLTRLLLQKGFTIHNLSRDPQLHGNPRLRAFKWDVPKNYLDPQCIDGVEAIIHLAGENIADKRWTAQRKDEIISSRVDSINLIYDLLRQQPDHQVKSIISASAIGYYGNRAEEVLTEDSAPDTGFLSKACLEWEKAVGNAEELNLRVVILRTGIILSELGGALPEIAKPIERGIGAVLGSGKQWMSWIHLQDVIRMYAFAVENSSLTGIYNMTAPYPVTNLEMTFTLAQILNRKLWLPNVPAFALRLALGELSTLVLDSAKVSSEKIQSRGFIFEFPEIIGALKNIYSE
jgi:uncharacterized protein (TIGR01777 family)